MMEEDPLRKHTAHDDWAEVYEQHMKQCRTYGPWIKHNAQAEEVDRMLKDDGRRSP
jgi:hypothetical protein